MCGRARCRSSPPARSPHSTSSRSVRTSSPATRWRAARNTRSAGSSSTARTGSSAADRHGHDAQPDRLLHLTDRRDPHDRGKAHARRASSSSSSTHPIPRRQRRCTSGSRELKALTAAENANHSLHNIQTLRGARTRDARNFARYLDETLERWGDEAEVHYGPHTWPVWGNADVTAMIASQRDTYKYIHDQALRLANQGYTPLEAAEEIRLPEELDRKWFNHGYHGTVHHDVRAVFTKELGMWDGDPVSLHPHPPVESAKRYVDFIGRDKVLEEGRRAVEAADYRWAVEILHKLVFADPDDTEARDCRPTRTSNSATRRKARSGEASSSPPPASSAKGSSRPRSRPRARTRSSGCRSTSCSTSSPSTSTGRKPPASTSGSTSSSPTSTSSGTYGSRAAYSTRGAGTRRMRRSRCARRSRCWSAYFSSRASHHSLPHGEDLARRRRRAARALGAVLDDFDPAFPLVTP